MGSGDVVLSGGLDPSRGLARVRIHDTTTLTQGAADLWQRALDVGRVVMAAEDLGTAERALDLAVAHAQERHAFGRPIGSFQAVKHRLVDVWSATDQLRSLVWWGAWSADSDPAQLPQAASAAKAHAARTLEQAAEAFVHVLGGIGFTWEHDAHLFWRRAKVDRLLLGDEATHLDRVARLALEGARAAKPCETRLGDL